MLKRIAFAALRGIAQDLVKMYVKSRKGLLPQQQFALDVALSLVLLVALRFIEGRREE